MNEMQRYGAQSEVSVNHLASVIRRRKWVIILTTLVCLGLAAAVSTVMTKRWQAEAQMVLIQRPIVQATSDSTAYNAPIEDRLETQVGMIQTDAMAERAIDWIKNRSLAQGRTADSVTVDPDQLVKAVTVYSPPESDLINVTVEANSREKAELWANAICQAFLEWKTDLAQKDIQRAQDLLQLQTGQAQREMQRDQSMMAAYKEGHRLVDIPSQEKALIELLQARDSDVATAQEDLASQNARLKSLGAQISTTDSGIRTGQGVPDDALVLSLQTQLTQMEIDRADQATKVTPEYPGVLQPMDAKIRDVKQRLAQAIKNALNSKMSSLPSQAALMDAYKQAQVQAAFSSAHLAAALSARQNVQGQMTSLPRSDMEFTQLANKADLAGTRYVRLQTALDAAKLEKSRTTGNVQITQAGMAPSLPFRPNWLINLALGAVLGLSLSLLAVITADQFDRRIHDLEGVRQLTSGAIIAALPKFGRRQIGRQNRGLPQPEMQEAFSQARVNLSMILQRTLMQRTLVMQRTAYKGLQMQETVLVTSAVPGEGVSFAASNLARSTARAGSRTVLVDANLRRPVQHTRFKIALTPGLADVLAGETTLDEALVATEIENLWLLPAGASSRNATDLIAQPNLAEVFEALRLKADNVIIDAPDCSGVSDALLLSDYADCVLQIVGINRVEEEAVLDASAALAGTGKPTVFLVNWAPRGKRNGYRGRVGLAATGAQNGMGASPRARLMPPVDISSDANKIMGITDREETAGRPM